MQRSRKKLLVLSCASLFGAIGLVSSISYHQAQKARAGFYVGDLVQVNHDIRDELSQTSDKSSSKKSDVLYALPKINLTSNDSYPILIDVNGDGLVDAVYSKPATDTLQYVLLNRGNGYEVAYSCYYSDDYDTSFTYRGTCANI